MQVFLVGQSSYHDVRKYSARWGYGVTIQTHSIFSNIVVHSYSLPLLQRGHKQYAYEAVIYHVPGMKYLGQHLCQKVRTYHSRQQPNAAVAVEPGAICGLLHRGIYHNDIHCCIPGIPPVLLYDVPAFWSKTFASDVVGRPPLLYAYEVYRRDKVYT